MNSSINVLLIFLILLIFLANCKKRIGSFNRLSVCKKVTISRTLIFLNSQNRSQTGWYHCVCHRIQNSSHEWIWQCHDKYLNFKRSILHSECVCKKELLSTNLHVLGWEKHQGSYVNEKWWSVKIVRNHSITFSWRIDGS